MREKKHRNKDLVEAWLTSEAKIRRTYVGVVVIFAPIHGSNVPASILTVT